MSTYIPGPGPYIYEGLEDLAAYRTFMTRVARYVSPLIFFFRIGVVSELGAREFVRRYRVYYFSLLERLIKTGWLPMSTGNALASNWNDGDTITYDNITWTLHKGYVKIVKPNGEEQVVYGWWVSPEYNQNRFEAFTIDLDELWSPYIERGGFTVWYKIGEVTEDPYGTIPYVKPLHEISRFIIKGTPDNYTLYEAVYLPEVEQVRKDIDTRIIVDDSYAELLYRLGQLPSDFVTESGYDPTTGYWMTPNDRFTRLFDIASKYIWGEDRNKGMWAVVRLWFSNAREAVEQYLTAAGLPTYYAGSIVRAIYRLIKFQTWVDRSFEGVSGWFNRLVFELSMRVHWYEPLAKNITPVLSQILDTYNEWELPLEIPYLDKMLGLTDEFFNEPGQPLQEPGVTLVEAHLIPAIPERIVKKTTPIYYPVKDEYGNRIVLTPGQQITFEVDGQPVTATFEVGKIQYYPLSSRDPVSVEKPYYYIPAPNPWSDTQDFYVINGYLYYDPGDGKLIPWDPLTVVPYAPLKWYSMGDVYQPVIDPETNQPLDITAYIGSTIGPPKIDEWLEVTQEDVTLELMDGTQISGTYILLKPAGQPSEAPDMAYITYQKNSEYIGRIFRYDMDAGVWVETGDRAPYRVVGNTLEKLVPEGEVIYYHSKYGNVEMYYWVTGILLTWHIFNLLHFIYGLFNLICHGDPGELLSLLIIVYSGSDAEDLNRVFSTHLSQVEWQQIGQLIDVFADVSEITFTLLIRWRRTRAMRGLLTGRTEALRSVSRNLFEIRWNLKDLLRSAAENPGLRRYIRHRYYDTLRRLWNEVNWVSVYDPTQGRFPYVTSLFTVGVWHFFNFASALQVIAAARQRYYDQLLEERGWVTAFEEWKRELHAQSRQQWKGIFSVMSDFFTMVFEIIFWALPILVAIYIAYHINTLARFARRIAGRAGSIIRGWNIRRIRRL